MGLVVDFLAAGAIILAAAAAFNHIKFVGIRLLAIVVAYAAFFIVLSRFVPVKFPQNNEQEVATTAMYVLAGAVPFMLARFAEDFLCKRLLKVKSDDKIEARAEAEIAAYRERRRTAPWWRRLRGF